MKKIRLFFGTIFLLLAVSGAAFASSAETVDLTVQGKACYDKAQELLGIINTERGNLSKDPLIMDSRLTEVAIQRAAELSIYFSHVCPDNYSYAIDAFSGDSIGEDILAGAESSQLTYDKWYSSPMHRVVMLGTHKYCGIGCVEVESTKYWVLLAAPKSYGSTFSQNNEVSGTWTIKTDKSNIVFDVWDWRYNDTGETFTGNSVYYGKNAEIGIRNVNQGDSGSLYRFYPQYLTYQSDDPSVFRVDPNGTVTPVSRGSAHLTVALKSSPDVKTTFPVNVISNTLRKTPTITLSSTSFLETGSEIRPGVTVRDCFGNPMVENRDYRLEYANNKNAGAASVRVYFLGNYSDPSAGNYDFVTKGFYITSNPDLHNPTPGDGEIGGGSVSGGSTGGNEQDENAAPQGNNNSGVSSDKASSTNIDITVSVPKVSIKKVVSSSKRTMTVKWKKQKKADGYQIEYALNKNFTKGKKTKNIAVRTKKKGKKVYVTNKILKGLKSRKTYYVRIRTCKIVNAKKYYGAWSKIKKVKVR